MLVNMKRTASRRIRAKLVKINARLRRGHKTRIIKLDRKRKIRM